MVRGEVSRPTGGPRASNLDDLAQQVAEILVRQSADGGAARADQHGGRPSDRRPQAAGQDGERGHAATRRPEEGARPRRREGPGQEGRGQEGARQPRRPRRRKPRPRRPAAKKAPAKKATAKKATQEGRHRRAPSSGRAAEPGGRDAGSTSSWSGGAWSPPPGRPSGRRRRAGPGRRVAWPTSRRGWWPRPSRSSSSGPARRFVGRGGDKLDAALDRFGIESAADGPSTPAPRPEGSPTASSSAGRPRSWPSTSATASSTPACGPTPGCVVLERTNIRTLDARRHLAAGAGPGRPGRRPTSRSSRSPPWSPVLAGPLAAPGADLVVLVKPQFEAGRAEVSRGRGVVRDPASGGAARSSGWPPPSRPPEPPSWGPWRPRPRPGRQRRVPPPRRAAAAPAPVPTADAVGGHARRGRGRRPTPGPAAMPVATVARPGQPGPGDGAPPGRRGRRPGCERRGPRGRGCSSSRPADRAAEPRARPASRSATADLRRRRPGREPRRRRDLPAARGPGLRRRHPGARGELRPARLPARRWSPPASSTALGPGPRRRRRHRGADALGHASTASSPRRRATTVR